MERALFLEMAERYKDTVFRIALNYLGSSYDADDIVQDVLMKLYVEEKVFDGDEHVRNWLIRVTINCCKNTRRLVWRQEARLDELSASFGFQHREQTDLFISVMRMKEKYRIVLYLFYYEDISVRQIAALLNISETAVTTRLSRARKILKQELMEV